MLLRHLFITILFLPCCIAVAQEPAADSATIQLKNPEQYINAVANKATDIDEKLDKKTAKAIAQVKKQEEKIIKQLQKIDSSAAKQLMENATARYKELEQKLKNPGKLQQYIPQIDSLGTSLNFLSTQSSFAKATEDKFSFAKATEDKFSFAKATEDKIKDAISKVDALKTQLQKAENLKQFLKERKEFLKQQLEKFGSRHGGQVAKQLKQLNKQVYYYSQQIAEYKALLKDPKKIERKALELLSKTKIWKEFFRKNSMLAGLFRMPGDPNDPTAQASLAGLQTRAQVNNLIQTQIAAGGAGAQQQFQQNIQAAQGQLNQLKDKVLKMGGGSSDADPDSDREPEGFRPNNQKTKSFWKRIELGTNLQNQKSNGLLPTTTDLGLTAGYKLNDKSIIGIGSSFKMGWNQPGSRRIQLSGQGASLRSFIDYKLKGSFWISGGYEMNYRNEYRSIEALRNYSAWQQSGLLGLSKVVSVKSKLFKKTRLMLLWDFLSYQQIPAQQPLVFRLGYNF